MAVDADGAVTAAPESGSLDGLAGSRVETVQLLTPEGERLEHPDYPLELSTDEVKGLYRDLVLVRRIDAEREQFAAYLDSFEAEEVAR